MRTMSVSTGTVSANRSAADWPRSGVFQRPPSLKSTHQRAVASSSETSKLPFRAGIGMVVRPRAVVRRLTWNQCFSRGENAARIAPATCAYACRASRVGFQALTLSSGSADLSFGIGGCSHAEALQSSPAAGLPAVKAPQSTVNQTSPACAQLAALEAIQGDE